MLRSAGVFAFVFGSLVCCATASAQVYAAGYVSWDVTFPGEAGEFDIGNLTGPNNSGDTSFPVTTELELSNLSLMVNFAGGSSETFGPLSGYFSLLPDGESFNGTSIPIGGTNPEPISATLSGNFSTTTISLDAAEGGGTINIKPTFAVSFSDTPNLVDGDNAIIYVRTVVSATPEPGTWMMMATGLVLLLFAGRSRFAPRAFGGAFKAATGVAVKGVLPLLCLVLVQSAYGVTPPQVTLIAFTIPSSGVAGTTNVNITGSKFPAGTINAANIIVAFETTCGGAPVVTEAANSIRTIAGSEDRVNVNIPGTGLAPGTNNYFLQISDLTGGDADFTSSNCSEVQVTASAPVLNACIAGSSVGVLLPAGGAAGNVTAYVPQGYWEGTNTGVFVKNIEGTLGVGTTVPTANLANSCSSNPATGQTVCVANNTDVYLISGTTLTNTLTSGANTTATFSGGTCTNCGVALNSNNNTAVINMGVATAVNGGVQILNLNTNTFGTAFPMTQDVSENISVDPTRSLILSAGEDGSFTLLQLQSGGGLLQYTSSWNTGQQYNDSNAEDCSTGIAFAPGEFTTSQMAFVNLNAITLNSPSAGEYTAPNANISLTTAYGFDAGPSGSAVAQGSGHLAVMTGEFGGNTFAVLKLPATASSAVPALVDYVVAAIPSSTACGGTFSAGFDPHTVTAYTSPNTGDSMAVFVGYSSATSGIGVPICLAVVDMTKLITSATRGGGGYDANDIQPANFPAGDVAFFTLP